MSSETDLIRYIKEVGHPLFPPNGLLWRVFLVKNYMDNESVVVFKYNHALSDGVGALLMACAFQGKPNLKQMPSLRKLTLTEKLLKYASLLTAPFYISREAIRANLVANDTVKAFNGVTDNYNFSTGKGYNVEDIKKVAKK
jgi:hypothetical protein